MSSNLISLNSVALENEGSNYLSWVLDAEMHLEAKKLGHTIIGGDSVSHERVNVVTYLRHHLSQTLKDEFMNCRDPQALWNSLRERDMTIFRVVTLPRIRNERIQLRFQDFKSVAAYNSALYKIDAQFEMCDEPLTEESKLEKTLSTFHSSQIVLHQMYSERRFPRYRDLIGCLLLAEQNNELLMKNHESRPCGSAPVPEVNKASYSGHGHDRGKQGYRGKKHKRGGRKHKNARHHPYNNKNTEARQEKGKGKELFVPKVDNPPKKNDNDDGWYRCGGHDHWFRSCRAAPHLCEPKNKNKKEADVEMNLAEGSISVESPKLEISDYLLDFGGNEYKIGFDEYAGGLFTVN